MIRQYLNGTRSILNRNGHSVWLDAWWSTWSSFGCGVNVTTDTFSGCRDIRIRVSLVIASIGLLYRRPK